jgi:hypothetical protein
MTGSYVSTDTPPGVLWLELSAGAPGWIERAVTAFKSVGGNWEDVAVWCEKFRTYNDVLAEGESGTEDRALELLDLIRSICPEVRTPIEQRHFAREDTPR